MGKYSLDAFEVYPLVKLRPSVAEPESGCYRLLELCRWELEPESGMLQPPEIGDDQVLLRLQWDLEDDISDVCGFIRRMGSGYAGGKNLEGVVLTSGTFTGSALEQLVHAYSRGFESTFLLVQPGTEVMEVCRREGIPTGLWLPLSEGILNLRRSIAKNCLARNWESFPVYICSDGKLSEEELDAARRWHVSGANVMAPLGIRMTLRRMMFPKDLTAGGVMPLRMWWQNMGTAPVYEDIRVRLVLQNEKETVWCHCSGNDEARIGGYYFQHNRVAARNSLGHLLYVGGIGN